jgi:tetratricopeptide (TPR) repeat protein
LAIAATIIFFSARDPYGVRQWRHGLECYEEGRFFEAVDCFGQSIDADPNQIAAYFDRGRARMQLSDFWLALGDFEQVRKRTDDGKNDGKIDAAIGHCLVQLGNFQEGAESLKRAIAAGFTTVEVYNDLGYAYFSTGKIPEALDALNEAAQRDPNLQPVLFNRALVYIQIAFTKRDRNAAELGIADLKKAIQLEPHGDLYWHLCTLYLLIERHELALASLEQAARLGSDIHKAEKDRLFRPLFAMAAFVELIRNPPNDAAIAPNTNRLADPLRTIR